MKRSIHAFLVCGVVAFAALHAEARATYTMRTSPYQTAEGESVTVTFSRTGDFSEPFSIRVFSHAREAIFESDIEQVEELLSWEANEGGAKTFSTQVFDDDISEYPEEFSLRFYAPEQLATVAPNGGEILFRVIDDDIFPPGDANLNNRVDFADFLMVAANFGDVVPLGRKGDVDYNNRVDAEDFLLVSNHFGESK